MRQNKIFKIAIQNIKYITSKIENKNKIKSAIDESSTSYNNLSLNTLHAINELADDTLLHLEAVSLKFNNNQNYTLKNIAFSMKNNSEIIVLLGSNGSGKSSLLKLINGTYQPTSGSIFFKRFKINNSNNNSNNGNGDNNNTSNNNFPKIVTLTQNVNDSLFNNLTVFENCLLWNKNPSKYKKNYNANNITDTDLQNNICMTNEHNKSMKKQPKTKEEYALYLQTFNPNLYNKLDAKVEELSGGEKQALILALCINLRPEILLLDEHTSALDPKLAELIMQITIEKARKYNIACIICTHNLSHAINFADRIIAIKNGKIIKNFGKNDNPTKEDLMCLYDM